MPSPLRKIGPALIKVMGEPATFYSDSAGLTATIRCIPNRGVQQITSGFGSGMVSERRTTLDLLRSELPAEPRPGDTVTLTETSEAFTLKRKDADDGDLITFIVQPVET